MSKLMRSISGIRGIVGDTLTPQVLKSHVRLFADYQGQACGNRPR